MSPFAFRRILEDVRLILYGFSHTLKPVMKLLLATLLLFVAIESSAQVRLPPQRRMKRDSLIEHGLPRLDPRQVAVRSFLGQIEHGIITSSLTSSSAHFASQVLVNISGGESGYFSSNQVLSVLQNYFSGRKPVVFHFSRFNYQGSAPYATGRLTFVNKGSQESAQIYVSLEHRDSRWVISQFNIY